MKLYYSEDYGKEMIELSDRHILWEINTPNDEEYSRVILAMQQEFLKIYKAHVYLLGRSGRHVCVPNTSENRRRVYNMTRTAERMQRQLIKMFS